ncbi:Hypothetical predicted protein [Paramuricea clavata]|uniref:Uncharacterized protein n=1 Tax=Paramuricea clavata TaxID=317549 RepID=A0A6S7IV05_PARCT|nr:Hypothetical predicted protein [Paramuricea clavata]
MGRNAEIRGMGYVYGSLKGIGILITISESVDVIGCWLESPEDRIHIGPPTDIINNWFRMCMSWEEWSEEREEEKAMQAECVEWEKREATKRWKKEIKTTADQFRKRRKQIETDARKATREVKIWERKIRKEERERRKEVPDWNTEAQKWKKESQRLRRNEKARERRAEQNRRIREGKWKGKKKFG